MASKDQFAAHLTPILRARNYKGSGATLRKVEGDCVFVVNFQLSRNSEEFFINLGGQPLAIPDEGDDKPNQKQLKEYGCVFRERVGKEWPRALKPESIFELRARLDRSVAAFEGKLAGVAERVRSEAPAALLKKLPFGSPPARGALHLARLSQALGDSARCRSYVEIGLELAGPRATILIAELRKLQGGPPLNP
jgi:hypothetical protein